ncbi:enoyl-CoA hydratase/isomerase family protein [Dehalococcoidia bacterium]|nr:enoyl-CoA hydratase/isomerase family protein [Dehalococcoidia bacterium]
MEYEGLTLEKAENIAVLTLNRPERLNALTMKMNAEFHKLFREVEEDDDVRVLIITGAGKGFCAGADVDLLASITQLGSNLPRQERLQAIGAFAVPLYNLEKPVIAAVNGIAAGAGTSIALLTDIRIASENARFSMSFVARGAIPDCGATFLMPRLIGAGKSLELMYTGDIIDAREAERIGLANRVVPHDILMDEAVALTRRLAKAAPLALAQIKRAVHNGLLNGLEQQLYFESYAQNFCFARKTSSRESTRSSKSVRHNSKGADNDCMEEAGVDMGVSLAG